MPTGNGPMTSHLLSLLVPSASSIWRKIFFKSKILCKRRSFPNPSCPSSLACPTRTVRADWLLLHLKVPLHRQHKTHRIEVNLERGYSPSTLSLLATPPRQPVSPGASASAASAAPSPYPVQDIQKITKRGFTREQAIEELRLFNGDVTKALVSLMAKSLGNPKKK